MQADSGAGPSLSQGPGALWELLNNIGPVAMAVLALLLVASLYSWAVILGKISTFGKAAKESRRFLRAFRKATRLQEIAALTGDYKFSPLAQVFADVYETYKRQTGGSGPPRNLAPLERTAQTSASEAVTSLERRMTWLATIAATSPFVGLFGTVVGIIDAFHGLGSRAWHLRGAHHPRRRPLCGRARCHRLQPVHRPDQGLRHGYRRFLPRVAKRA